MASAATQITLYIAIHHASSEESLAALASIGAAIVRPGGLGSTHSAWWDVALDQGLVSSAGLLGKNRGGTLQLGLPLPLAALT